MPPFLYDRAVTVRCARVNDCCVALRLGALVFLFSYLFVPFSILFTAAVLGMAGWDDIAYWEGWAMH